VSVEKRRKGGHTVYLARWREVTRRRARTFTRKADAEAFERERRREAALGAHGLARALPDVTRDWLRRWWDAEAAGWAPSTRRTQASSIDLWIEPYGGGGEAARPRRRPGAALAHRRRPTRPRGSCRPPSAWPFARASSGESMSRAPAPDGGRLAAPRALSDGGGTREGQHGHAA
jgi:hypothetical protein